MKDFAARVKTGFGWVLASTLVCRLIQLAAMAVTTNLLPPVEFGLLAVVLAATLLMERLTTFGLDAGLVQGGEITPQMLNVAWSYQFARGLLLGLVVFGAAPWLAAAFREPAATDMIRCAALGFPLAGLRNLGLVRLRKALDFRTLSYVDLVPVVVHALASVGLAVALRSVWALVIASVVLAASSTLVSYRFAPHWPRFDFTWTVARPLFAFGLYLLGNTLLQTVREQGIVLVLARVISLDELGVYNRAAAFSVGLFVQVQAVYWRVMFPAMAALQSDLPRLAVNWRNWTVGLGVAGMLGAGVYVLSAPLLVRWGLGDVWAPMIPVLQVFGWYLAILALTAPSEVLLQALGRPGIGTHLQTANTLLALLLFWPAIQRWGLPGAAVALTTAGALVAPCALVLSYRLLSTRKAGVA
jgi:PST family polysaccharide transporter/lipopolysaccharide exporter